MLRLDGHTVETTVGRALQRGARALGLPFANDEMDKKALEQLVADCHRNLGDKTTTVILDLA